MDDYVHVLIAYLTHLPIQTLHSPCLPTAFSHILATLQCPSISTVLTCLDALSILCDLLQADAASSSGGSGPAAIIMPIFAQYGKAIVGMMVEGAVSDFPEDSLEQVQVVLSTTTRCAPPDEVKGWVGEAVGGLRAGSVGLGDRGEFVRELNE